MTLLIIFGIGFISSLLGGIVTGTTSLMGLSLLLFIGVPPHITLATYRVGILGFRIGAVYEYIKAGKIIKSLLLPLSIIAVIGALVGSTFIISIDEDILAKVIGIVLLLFIPITLLNQNLGVEQKEVSTKKKYVGYFAYFLAAVWASSFAAGVGIFVLFTYMYFFGRTILETKGTDKIPSLFLDVTAVIVFIVNGLVVWPTALAFLAGMTIGSAFSAKITLKIGDKWLRIILLVVIGFLAVKLLFGL